MYVCMSSSRLYPKQNYTLLWFYFKPYSTANGSLVLLFNTEASIECWYVCMYAYEDVLWVLENFKVGSSLRLESE